MYEYIRVRVFLMIILLRIRDLDYKVLSRFLENRWESRKKIFWVGENSMCKSIEEDSGNTLLGD